MKYVNQQSAEKALAMEETLANLPDFAGIIFVSVSAQPEEGGVCDTFEVRLGIYRSFNPSTGTAIIKRVFQKELESGIKIQAIVNAGVPGRRAHSDDNRAAPVNEIKSS